MALLIFYVALALGVSFLCSIMEAVLLSVSPSFVAKMEASGSRTGRRLAALKEKIDQPLAAILSLNTIAHTVGAAGAGAQAVAVFGNAYVGVASGVLTFLILVVSEVIPKTLGAVYWRQLTGMTVRVLRPTILLMWPLVKMAEGLTWLLTRGKEKVTIHRDEFGALADVGVREGVLQKHESHLLQNMLRFDDLVAKDIMTPRTVIFALPSSTTVDDVVADHEPIPFSRIPVYQSDKDNIEGFVLKTDILLHAARGNREMQLKDLVSPIASVSDSMPLQKLFEKLVEDRSHIALVISEYGGTSGIVTLEDIVETLLGLEIVDEVDEVTDMQRLARQQWEKRAEQRGVRLPDERS